MRKRPAGKLPPDLLRHLLARHAPQDPRLVLPPGIGIDCAVLDLGDRLLVAKSDPVTFAVDEIGWYAVHVNANDVATTGARPQWFLATVLLPQDQATDPAIDAIFEQVEAACRQIGACLVGGHTEITAGIDRPILAGTMLGEVARDRLISPRGAQAGDLVLLTKGIPLEGASLLAREFASRLEGLPVAAIQRARAYLHSPGISIVPEALAAADAGGVSAMHDPTEGGLAAALWELAEASGVGLEIDIDAVPILPEAALLCGHLGLDPLATIASGALLLTVDAAHAADVLQAVADAGVDVRQIGTVSDCDAFYVAMRSEGRTTELPRPDRDAIALLFDRQDQAR